MLNQKMCPLLIKITLLTGSHTLLPDRLVYNTPPGPYVGVASYLHVAGGFVATKVHRGV